MTVAICSRVIRPGRNRRGGRALPGVRSRIVELDADRAAAAVEDQLHRVTEFVAHVRRFGRTDPAEAVGRWGGNAAHAGQAAAGSGIGAQQIQRQRMRRHAQADTVLATGDGTRHGRGPFEDQGQRAGPEGLGKFPGDGRNFPRPALEIAVGRKMDDQRMIGRSSLGGEDPGDGRGIRGVGTEAVDRLGRKGDQFAGLQQCDRAIDRVQLRAASTIPIAARAVIATCRARSGSASSTVKCPILRPGRA